MTTVQGTATLLLISATIWGTVRLSWWAGTKFWANRQP